MKILGIDPGTATTGWAIISVVKGDVSAIAYGHISTPKDRTDSERLLEITDDLSSIIAQFKPDEAVVEQIFFFKNAKTVITVSQARGAVLLTLERAQVPIFEYTPLQIKQTLTSYGRAGKKQMQEMVRQSLKLNTIPTPDDTADALAAAICHAKSRTGLKKRGKL